MTVASRVQMFSLVMLIEPFPHFGYVSPREGRSAECVFIGDSETRLLGACCCRAAAREARTPGHGGALQVPRPPFTGHCPPCPHLSFVSRLF